MGAFDGELTALGYSGRNQTTSGKVRDDLVRVQAEEGLECTMWITPHKTARVQILHIFEKFIVFRYLSDIPYDKALHDHCSSNQCFYVESQK